MSSITQIVHEEKTCAIVKDQGPFTRLKRNDQTSKSKPDKPSGPNCSINRNNVIYSQRRSFSRLRHFSHPKFQGQEVLWKFGYAPLNKSSLEIVFSRFNAMTALAGVNAACIRLDFPSGTPAEKIQALLARLQDQARLRETKIHYVVQAECVADQGANHWHGIILFDQSKMDFPRQINTTWKKVCPEYRIIYRRNGNLPFFFAIGKNPEDFKSAFRAASYLCKLDTPPLKSGNKKTRITSRLRPRASQNEPHICKNIPATIGEYNCIGCFGINRPIQTTDNILSLLLQAI